MASEYRNEFMPPPIKPYFMNAQGGEPDNHVMTQDNEQADFGVINPQITMSVQEAEMNFTVEELSKIKKEFEVYKKAL